MDSGDVVDLRDNPLSEESLNTLVPILEGRGVRVIVFVNIPDPNLEAAIREAIGKPTGPITEEDLQGITSLDAGGRGIEDLTGLEHCTNLQELRLWDNQIADISPLSGLNNLQLLHLCDNQIANISPPLPMKDDC